MATIVIDKANRELDALVKRARAGEEIVLSDGEAAGRQASSTFA